VGAARAERLRLAPVRIATRTPAGANRRPGASGTPGSRPRRARARLRTGRPAISRGRDTPVARIRCAPGANPRPAGPLGRRSGAGAGPGAWLAEPQRMNPVRTSTTTRARGRRRTRRAIASLGLATGAALVPATAAAEPWSRATIAALPDEAFAVVRVRPDGTRARHLPHHDADGRLDLQHLRSALARLGQVRWEDTADAERARRHLVGHAAALGWPTGRPARPGATERGERPPGAGRPRVDPTSSPPWHPPVDGARAHPVSQRGLEGPPTLADEILSPSTATIDRSRKLRLHARHGIQCCWIVDPRRRRGRGVHPRRGSGPPLLVRASWTASTALPRSPSWRSTPRPSGPDAAGRAGRRRRGHVSAAGARGPPARAPGAPPPRFVAAPSRSAMARRDARRRRGRSGPAGVGGRGGRRRASHRRPTGRVRPATFARITPGRREPAIDARREVA
jgi:hypothetical protein